MSRPVIAWIAGSAVAALSASAGPAFGQTPAFDAVELPNLVEPAPSFAQDINDSGVVVGVSQATPEGETFRPWLWSVEGGMVNLLPFAGFTWFATATDINNAGEVLGFYTDLCPEPDPHPECPIGVIPGGGVFRGVLWATDGSGGFTEIPSPASDFGLDNLGVTPGALGEDGRVGASAQLREPGEFSFGFPLAILWDQRADPFELGDGTIPGYTVVNITDINGAGQYVGIASMGQESRGFFFDPQSGYTVLPRVSDPSKGAEQSNAIALNNHGHVVGTATVLVVQDGVLLPQSYGSYLWSSGGGMQHLGLYEATDINDAVQIVGSTVAGTTGGDPDAVLYDDGTWHVLQDGTDVDPENWHFLNAAAINNAGQIVVNAGARNVETILASGEIQPFLLTPVDEPTAPGDVDGDGDVDVDDLVALLLAWGECPAAAPCAADLDGDGSVDVDDLVLVIVNWS